MDGMNELLHDMPETVSLLDNARKGLKSQIEAQRIIRQDVLMNYDNAVRLGTNYDIRRNVYAGLDALGMNELRRFHTENCRDRVYSYCILGSVNRIDLESLAQYGQVQMLTMEEIFGY